MKKYYENPLFELIVVKTEDILADSPANETPFVPRTSTPTSNQQVVEE